MISKLLLEKKKTCIIVDFFFTLQGIGLIVWAYRLSRIIYRILEKMLSLMNALLKNIYQWFSNLFEHSVHLFLTSVKWVRCIWLCFLKVYRICFITVWTKRETLKTWDHKTLTINIYFVLYATHASSICFYVKLCYYVYSICFFIYKTHIFYNKIL